MSDETPKVNAGGLIEFSIKHQQPPLSQYSNHMLVQGDAECLYLHFFQLRPPIIIEDGPKPEQLVADAVPLASVAIDLGKAQIFVEAILRQLERHKEVKLNG